MRQIATSRTDLRLKDCRGVWSAVLLSSVCAMLRAAEISPTTAPVPVLTNAQQVLSLGFDGARRSHALVKLYLVVTQPQAERLSVLAQDNTGALLVNYTNRAYQPAAGQWIEVEGRTQGLWVGAGVELANVQVVGTAPWPEPKRAEVARLEAGEDFGRWVSIVGRVRDLKIIPGRLEILVAAGSRHFIAFMPFGPRELPRTWLDASVEMRGLVFSRVNERNQATGFLLGMTGTNDLTVLEAGHTNVFDAPALARPVTPSVARARVTGVVTFTSAARLFVQTADGPVQGALLEPISHEQSYGIYLDRSYLVPLRPGDRVELVGEATGSAYAPSLLDVEYRRLGEGVAPAPRVVSGQQLLSGGCDASLVTVRARLRDRTLQEHAERVSERLTLEADGVVFQAQFDGPETNALADLPRDAVVRVTGVCTVEAGRWKQSHVARLWLAGPESVRYLGQPPAWTDWPLEKLLLGALVLGAAAAAWIVLLRRRVAVRTGELAQSNALLQVEVDERKRAEADLARALEAEKDLSQLKSRFVSLVSHEFRTPLGVILASADLLSDYLDTLTPEERAEQLADIKQSTRHMANLMEDVLILGRVESGKMHFHPVPLDVSEFCRRLIDEMLSATNRRCPICISEQNISEPARGDETLLRHIFHNLLSNGVKYSRPDQPVEFCVERDGGDAVFTVKDSGIGILAEDQKHLFDAFYRGKNVGQRTGSGLGLVIVKRCVELHGGTIKIQSTEGAGTTATVRLPLFHKTGQTDILRRPSTGTKTRV